MKAICDNCGKTWPESKLAQISDEWERLEPGGIVPSGQCPHCGALCYPEIPDYGPLIDFAEAAAGIIAWAKDHGAKNAAALERMRKTALRRAGRC